MSIEELYMYFDYGLELEEYRAVLVIQKLNEALGGKQVTQKKNPHSDKPDKEKFYKYYGNQIKRPEGDERK